MTSASALGQALVARGCQLGHHSWANGAWFHILNGAAFHLWAYHYGRAKMQYRTLGRTGVQVSTLVLGAMNFGKIGNTTQEEATAIVDGALDAGINLIDTADAYSGGQSEEMVGKAIAGRRDDVVLATKATLPMGDERNQRGGSRRWLVTALENSLRRLGVDHVDLYQMHRWDPTTSDDETLSALTDLQRAG